VRAGWHGGGGENDAASCGSPVFLKPGVKIECCSTMAGVAALDPPINTRMNVAFRYLPALHHLSHPEQGSGGHARISRVC